ncbi:hypothetical protein GCM10018963_64310 [Saccharothrix longispora]
MSIGLLGDEYGWVPLNTRRLRHCGPRAWHIRGSPVSVTAEPQHRPEAARLLEPLHAPLTGPRYQRLPPTTHKLLGS